MRPRVRPDFGDTTKPMPTQDEIDKIVGSREQVRGSDLYSPMVKRVMEKFWKILDKQKSK